MVHEQNVSTFNVKGQEQLKHRVLTKAGSCAEQEADACAAVMGCLDFVLKAPAS